MQIALCASMTIASVAGIGATDRQATLSTFHSPPSGLCPAVAARGHFGLGQPLYHAPS
jgi:hypothetical protein